MLSNKRIVFNNKQVFIYGGIMLLVCLALFTQAVAVAQTGTVVRVDPAVADIEVDGTVDVQILIDDVADLFAADIEISFDAAVLQVSSDGDAAKDGIQVAPGNALAPDFVARNVVDNQAGSISYALTQIPPSAPANGSGVLLSFTFQGAQNGLGNITITKLDLSTNQGQRIEATLAGGQIVVGVVDPDPDTPTPVSPTDTPIPTPDASTPTPDDPTPTPDGEVTPTATPPGPGDKETPTPGEDGVIEYVVQPGDTLFSIARRFNTTVLTIARFNNIYNVNLIFIGQVLRIPTGDGPSEIVYTIKLGDTLFSIGRRYGVTVQQLVDHNKIVNPDLIFAGEVIHIPQ